MSLNIPSFLQAFNHLSPIKWAMGNMAPYTLRGVKFTCDEYQKIDGRCPITTGEEALALYKLGKDPEMYIMALGVCTIVYRLVAYLILKCVKERWIGRAWKKVGGGRLLKEQTPQPSGATGEAMLR
jgi:hypothetical protein